MDILSNFSESLKELMDNNNLSCEKLGDIIGVTKEAVRLWKNGKSNISLTHLIKLADYFHCSIEFLIGRSQTFIDYAPKACDTFYTSLQSVMKEKSITRYNVVKNTKIYDSYFTNWKNNAVPNILTLVTLADYSDCTIDYLIGRE
ncbi:MAG: helix-turn-helix transcriptional regulator [Clostridia bacterium]